MAPPRPFWTAGRRVQTPGHRFAVGRHVARAGEPALAGPWTHEPLDLGRFLDCQRATERRSGLPSLDFGRETRQRPAS